MNYLNYWLMKKSKKTLTALIGSLLFFPLIANATGLDKSNYGFLSNDIYEEIKEIEIINDQLKMLANIRAIKKMKKGIESCKNSNKCKTNSRDSRRQIDTSGPRIRKDLELKKIKKKIKKKTPELQKDSINKLLKEMKKRRKSIDLQIKDLEKQLKELK